MDIRFFKYLCLFVVFCAVSAGMLPVYAQTNDNIRKLEKQRADLQEQIKESESLLNSTGKTIKNSLDNLSLLTAQIAERKKYINRLNSDIRYIDNEIRKIDKSIADLEVQLGKTKERYAKSLRYMRSNRGIQEKLLFIFSAGSLQHMYRRLRYVEEYAAYQRVQADEIIKKQTELKNKRLEKNNALASKKKVLKEREAEQKKLEEQEKLQKKMIDQLKRKQSSISSEIKKQKKKANDLNAKIDRLIQIEIEKARKRAEEERKRREAEQSKGTGKEKTESGSRMDAYKMSSADKILSDDFEKNKGILPMPVTGGYIVVNHYGKYDVPGLRNVQLDNKGIDIQTQPGSMARSIFKGEVSAIFEYSGLKGVLIRHGNYISVYCNLSSVLVKQGDKVDVKQAIGKIFSNSNDNNRTVLHFQLRKETTKLNPELWLDD